MPKKERTGLDDTFVKTNRIDSLHSHIEDEKSINTSNKDSLGYYANIFSGAKDRIGSKIDKDKLKEPSRILPSDLVKSGIDPEEFNLKESHEH